MPSKGHINLADAQIGDYFVLKLQNKSGGSSFIEEIWSVDYDGQLGQAIQKILQDYESRKH